MSKRHGFAGLMLGALVYACAMQGSPEYRQSQRLRQAAAACPVSPAPGLMDKAMCLCGELQDPGTGLTTRAPNGGRADVGVNGQAYVEGHHYIEGSYRASRGFRGAGDLSVRDELATPRDLETRGAVEVGGDVLVGGQLKGPTVMTAGGALRTVDARGFRGPGRIQGLGLYQAVANSPCACGEQGFDVAEAVNEAKRVHQNAEAGLGETLSTTNAVLKTGTYYFEDVRSLEGTTLQIEGQVAVYLKGSLDVLAGKPFTLSEGSTLDLYVSGDVERVGSLQLGTQVPPTAFRLYIGGAGTTELHAHNGAIRGMIYAPNADLETAGDALVEGALFGRDLRSHGALEIDYLPAQSNACASKPVLLSQIH